MNGTFLLNPRSLLAIALMAVIAVGCDDSSGSPDGPTDGGSTETSDDVTVSGNGVVVLNEISSGGELADWIELHNPGDEPVDVGGWRLTDEDPTHVTILAEGRKIEAGEHLLLLRDDPSGFTFGLGGSDAVSLFDASGTLVDFVSWSSGEAPDDMSYGRIPDGTGAFTTLESPTPGAKNAANPTSVCGDGVAALDETCDGDDLKGLRCEDMEFTGTDLGCASDCQSLDTAGCTALSLMVVINEVSSSGDDPIELYNPGDGDVDLSGWRLTDENDAPEVGPYFFPTGSILKADEYLLLTKGADHAFGLGGNDEVRLRDTGGLLVDRVAWGKGDAEISWCRIPDGTGEPGACAETTWGEPNAP